MPVVREQERVVDAGNYIKMGLQKQKATDVKRFTVMAITDDTSTVAKIRLLGPGLVVFSVCERGFNTYNLLPNIFIGPSRASPNTPPSPLTRTGPPKAVE